MNDVQVSLTDPEREYLVELLENCLKNQRIEEHRTRSPNYRKGILQEENHLIQILTKLGKIPE